MDGLTVGRNVHYVTAEGQHMMALVVYVWDKEAGTVNLTVFDNLKQQTTNLIFAETSVRYSESCEPNTWHWIEKA